jgi:hypothetical protein
VSATPRTDRAANESILAVYEESKRLENELAAVTKQRDELKSFVLSIVDANGPHQDVNGTSVIPTAYATLSKLIP